jgi:hypothetical protein
VQALRREANGDGHSRSVRPLDYCLDDTAGMRAAYRFAHDAVSGERALVEFEQAVAQVRAGLLRFRQNAGDGLHAETEIEGEPGACLAKAKIVDKGAGAGNPIGKRDDENQDEQSIGAMAGFHGAGRESYSNRSKEWTTS